MILRMLGALPARELIDDVRAGSISALSQLYETRRVWCKGYPFVHHRVVTYGVFDDLRGVISPKTRVKLLPQAFEIALSESDENFSVAVMLLSTVIYDDSRLEEVEVDLSNVMDKLYQRYVMLSDMPNLAPLWGEMLERCKLLRPADGQPWGKEQIKALIAKYGTDKEFITV